MQRVNLAPNLQLPKQGPHPRSVFIGPSSLSFADASPIRSRFPPSVSSAPEPDATDAARALLTFSSHDSRLPAHKRKKIISANKDQIVKAALCLRLIGFSFCIYIYIKKKRSEAMIEPCMVTKMIIHEKRRHPGEDIIKA